MTGQERPTVRRVTPVYTIDSISPLMDDHVRQILERRVDQLPIIHNRVRRCSFRR